MVYNGLMHNATGPSGPSDSPVMVEADSADTKRKVEKINIDVMDSNTILSDVLIGSTELELGTVYASSPHHELWRQWIALASTGGIQGFIKLSVVVLAPGDEQIIHDEREDETADRDKEVDGISNVLMPVCAELEEYELKVMVHAAEGLPQMDDVALVTQGCDAYAQVSFGGTAEVKTKVLDSRNPVWAEELHMPVFLPALSDTIRIQAKSFHPMIRCPRVATAILALIP
ncbi:hypothetical protein CYMTET_3377 [Cymbomonas tetramitiformis]|uniref:C2 domain-containing protein n=1 Tax=Cymbomonas tetramitiformis TaxID=36881 RepID=A0AAE0LLL4_9CHLO|nr:hypothetical protein CYMTET_3377 [Cymbomonas tetramitiformis]